MKKIYWRPSGVSRSMLLMLALFSLGGMTVVEVFKTTIEQKMYKEKLKAARRMKQAIKYLAEKREKISGSIDQDNDPTHSGLIGALMTNITSTSGHLGAKQTSINPNWAAVMIEHFRRAKLQVGDTIAIGFSGSFPALNLATIIAAESYGLKPLVTTGVTSSMWGANLPEFTWLDIERHLLEARIISTKSLAASLGGQGDRGRGLSKKGIQLVKSAILRNGVQRIEAQSTQQSMDQRMAIYLKAAGESEIKAYVNVGGNTVSVGSSLGKKLYKEGLNLRPSATALSVDSMMSRFAREGLPVIHMIRVKNLAEKYGLPIEPKELSKPGEGRIFIKEEYNMPLAFAVLLSLCALLYIFIKSDLGFRIFYSAEMKDKNAQPPSQMV